MHRRDSEYSRAGVEPPPTCTNTEKHTKKTLSFIIIPISNKRCGVCDLLATGHPLACVGLVMEEPDQTKAEMVCRHYE